MAGLLGRKWSVRSPMSLFLYILIFFYRIFANFCLFFWYKYITYLNSIKLVKKERTANLHEYPSAKQVKINVKMMQSFLTELKLPLVEERLLKSWVDMLVFNLIGCINRFRFTRCILASIAILSRIRSCSAMKVLSLFCIWKQQQRTWLNNTLATSQCWSTYNCVRGVESQSNWSE